MTTPALQAHLDQLSAIVRDAYDEFGVDVHDTDQARAIRTTWLLVAAQSHNLPWMLTAISRTV